MPDFLRMQLFRFDVDKKNRCLSFKPRSVLIMIVVLARFSQCALALISGSTFRRFASMCTVQ